MNNPTKIILTALFASFFLVQNAHALQEVAGPLVISVPVGGSNSVRWGLINDGSQTITVSLNATGDAAKYLSFPATVDLVPGKTVYVNVTANIPADYNLGHNITGTLTALQEGKPGQVQINVQMMKSVTITVTGEYVELKQTSQTAQPEQNTVQATQSAQTSPLTGLTVLASGNYLATVLIIILIFIAFEFFYLKNSRERKLTKYRGEE